MATNIPLHEETADELAGITDPEARYVRAAETVKAARVAKGNARSARTWALWALHAANRREWPKSACYKRYSLARRNLNTDFDNIKGAPPGWLAERLAEFDVTTKLSDLWITPDTLVRVSQELANDWEDPRKWKSHIENLVRAIDDVEKATSGLVSLAGLGQVPVLSPSALQELLADAEVLVERAALVREQLGRRELDIDAAYRMREAARPVAVKAAPLHAELFPALQEVALAEADKAHQEWLEARSREKTALPVRVGVGRELEHGAHGRSYSGVELARLGGLSAARTSQVRSGRHNPRRENLRLQRKARARLASSA